MNKITYLDGKRLHRALVAGVNNVICRQEYLNKINVFPVPDGDTGTNMVFTLTSILDSTHKQVCFRADEMLALIADAALDGARGNSGVILAQFLLTQLAIAIIIHISKFKFWLNLNLK